MKMRKLNQIKLGKDWAFLQKRTEMNTTIVPCTKSRGNAWVFDAEWACSGFPSGRVLVGQTVRKAPEGWRTPGRWRVAENSILIVLRWEI